MRKWLGLVIVITSMVGCATPQTITIETSPAGAAVSINDEYIGKSPTVYEMEDASAFKRIRVLAEKQSYESTLKLIKRKPNGTFPQQIFLKLDPTMSAAETKASGMTTQMGGQQQGGTTIQGPTIVIPGMALAPQAITPPPAPSPAPSGQQIIPLQN